MGRGRHGSTGAPIPRGPLRWGLFASRDPSDRNLPSPIDDLMTNMKPFRTWLEGSELGVVHLGGGVTDASMRWDRSSPVLGRHGKKGGGWVGVPARGGRR